MKSCSDARLIPNRSTKGLLEKRIKQCISGNKQYYKGWLPERLAIEKRLDMIEQKLSDSGTRQVVYDRLCLEKYSLEKRLSELTR
jgi:hypothetical protein